MSDTTRNPDDVGLDDVQEELDRFNQQMDTMDHEDGKEDRPIAPSRKMRFGDGMEIPPIYRYGRSSEGLELYFELVRGLLKVVEKSDELDNDVEAIIDEVENAIYLLRKGDLKGII